jgi:hypothetical protein
MEQRKLTSAEKRLVIAAAFGALAVLGLIVWAVLAIIAKSAP